MKLFLLHVLLLAIIIATRLNAVMAETTVTVLASSNIKCEMQSTDYTFVSLGAGDSLENLEETEEWNCYGDDDILYDLAGMWERIFSEHTVISGETTLLFSYITIIPEADPIYGLPQIVIDENSEIELVNDDSGGLVTAAVTTDDGSTTLSVPSISGEREVLVVRVTDASGVAPNMNRTGISNRVFGIFGEVDSLKSQMGACSGNQLQLMPSTRTSDIIDGVLELTINVNVTDFDNSQRKFLERAVNDMLLFKAYSIKSFGLVLYIMPESANIGSGVLGYAYLSGVKSVYRGVPSFPTLMHEIGHNFGLSHSGLEDNLDPFLNEYGDETCQMGSSAKYRSKCFNGAKSHRLGWYNYLKIGHEDLDSEASWRGKLVGVHDYYGENYNGAGCEGHRVVVNIGTLFIAFNRAESFTRDVPEQNTVAVTEELTVDNRVRTMRKIDGLLSENDVRTFETASGEKYSVMVCKITIDENDSNELDYADVIIYRNDDESIIKSCDIEVPANACPLVAVNQDNTSTPSTTPSISPTEAPSDTPSSRPSFSPSESPSLAPSIASSVSPTNTPSDSPSSTPSFSPTAYPTNDPTKEPTDVPTNSPTKTPTQKPTESPTRQTMMPSENPSMYPSPRPSYLRSSSPSSFPVDPPSHTLMQECNPSDAIMVSKNGFTMFDEDTSPIRITSQNTTGVEFDVVNTFNATFTSVFTQYDTGTFGQNICLEEQNIEPLSIISDYKAICTGTDPYTIVRIWISDDANNGDVLSPKDNSSIPKCCHPRDDEEVFTVMYTFKLSCVNPCDAITNVK